MTKKEGNLKLKSDKLKMKDLTLAAIIQGFEDQLDKAKWNMKLGEKKVTIITNAYEDLVSQAVDQFDAGMDAIVQTVRSLWPDLDMARLEQTLNQPAPQPSRVVHAYTALPAIGSELPEVSQSSLSTGSSTTITLTVVTPQANDS